MLDKTKQYENLVLTGFDEKTEWQFEWFYDNFNRHCPSSVKLMVCDFGMSWNMREKLRRRMFIEPIMDMTKTPDKGWFNKPIAMINSPAKKTLWLDTDCEVKSSVGPLFDLIVPNKLNMVEDVPWTKRRGETWYNSGVVGVMGKPPILHTWCNAVRSNPEVGDQEVLHSVMSPITQLSHINPLPFEWNVMRLATDVDNYKGPIKIQHHTGPKGKEKIKGLMKIRDVING